MSRTTADTPVEKKEIFLPLEPLLTLLRNKGFLIKPDDYIEMLKVVERFGSADIDRTARWLCPIIATSETEQKNFYKVVEEYKRLSGYSTKADPPSRRIPFWVTILLVVCLGAIAVYFIKIIFFQPAAITVLPYPSQTVAVGDTVHLDATQNVAAITSEPGNVNIKWEVEDGESKAGIKVDYIFDSAGSYKVRRTIEIENQPGFNISDSFFVRVCDDLTEVEIIADEETFTLGKEYTFTANSASKKQKALSYSWRFHDSIINTTETSVKYIFNKPGYYTIECTAYTGAQPDDCSATDSKMFRVIDPLRNYQIAIADGGTPFTPATRPQTWLTLLLLLPAAAGLIYSLVRPRKKEKTEKEKASDAVDRETKPKPAPAIPFENNAPRLVKQERDLRSVFFQMQQKAEEENLTLSISKTISTTIKSGGIPSLVFAPALRKQSYLVLVDQTNPKSMVTHLFDYLVSTLTDEAVPVSRFYYNRQFTCFNHEYPSGISLQRLGDMYGFSTLIILGKAHELVYRAYPVIEDHLLKELNRWENKVIVTPTPFVDWGQKEKVLQESLLLLPADVAGLQKIMPSLREKAKNLNGYLQANLGRQEKISYIDFKDCDELYGYINDNVIFQWLCAACVFPKLRWEVLIEVGKTILEKYDQPEKLNYSSLLKLCRISWMGDGIFPQHVRLELLKRLQVENEIAARETLLKLLTNVNIFFGDDNYFKDEIQLQILTNQFVLYAHDKMKYQSYASSKEAFERLYKSRSIIDAPLKKYLEKPKDENYDTPLHNQNQSVGLGEYFNISESKPVKSRTINRRVVAGICSLLLVAIWVYVLGSNEPLSVGSIALNQTDLSKKLTVNFAVAADFSSCGDSNLSNMPVAGFLANPGRDTLPLLYNKQKATASVDIPYEDLLSPDTAVLHISWSPDDFAEVPISFRSGKVFDSVTVRCLTDTSKSPIESTTNKDDTVKQEMGVIVSLPNSLNEIWHSDRNNRLININLYQKIIYYSTGSESSYGTYRILNTYKQPGGGYKIITQFGQSYKAFLIKNISVQSFDLSVCQDLYKSQVEAINSSASLCDAFNTMTLYQRKTATLRINTVELYGNTNTLSAKQVDDISKIVSAIIGDQRNANAPAQTSLGVAVQAVYFHSPYVRAIPSSVVTKNFKSNGFNISFDTKKSYTSIAQANPFVRDYLEFSKVQNGRDDSPPIEKIKVTPTLLQNVLRGIDYKTASVYADEFNSQFSRYEINTVNRAAAFLAQVSYESGGLQNLDERKTLNLSADEIMKIWGSRFKSTADARPYINNAEKLANYIYANRMGNGNEASGDGYTFRGRGLFLFTGKTNYQTISKLTGVDFTAYPDYLSQPGYAVQAACAWWQNQGLNQLADKEDMQAITRKINGGTNGLSEITSLYKKAKDELSSSQYPMQQRVR